MARLSVGAAEVRQARSRPTRDAQTNLSKTTLASPIDGTVIELTREVGERVRGSDFSEDVVMTIAALSTMEVKIEVGEHEVVHLEAGQHAELTVDALEGQTFEGSVVEIAQKAPIKNPGTESEVTTFPVTVALDTPAAGRAPGHERRGADHRRDPRQRAHRPRPGGDRAPGEDRSPTRSRRSRGHLARREEAQRDARQGRLRGRRGQQGPRCAGCAPASPPTPTSRCSTGSRRATGSSRAPTARVEQGAEGRRPLEGERPQGAQAGRAAAGPRPRSAASHMLIELKDIRRYYQVGTEEVHALNGRLLRHRPKGEWVAIIGQSGSGKSTLMNVLGLPRHAHRRAVPAQRQGRDRT